MIGNNLPQNAYEFLANTNIALFSTKPRSKNSNPDSRCSNKDASGSNSVIKNTNSNFQSNFTATTQPFNNTTSTTICSNRKQGNQGEILSAKKHSHQHNYHGQPLLAPNINNSNINNNDNYQIAEISSDRQTLKMNDFLKQIEAYSNEKLDKFVPQMQQ